MLRPNAFHVSSIRAAVIVAAVALLAIAAFGSTASAATIKMLGPKGGIRFEGPKTVLAGEELKVVNKSNPKQIGPHTFSLVTQASLPKTQKARASCFAPKHICRAIALWHGVKGNGPVKVNPVEVGNPGWDTMGSKSTEGDSWFTGNKPGTSYSQPVTVDTSAGPTRLYFLCAIHPEMQGSINVLPAG